jgi:hypothetical protein
MEKQKNSIDSFFRESLKAHEIVPSKRAKEAFLKEASEIPRRRRYRGGIILIMAVTMLVILGSLTFYYFLSNPSVNESAEVRSEPDVYIPEKKTSSPVPVTSTNRYPTNVVKQANVNIKTNVNKESTNVKTIPTIQPANPFLKNNESTKAQKPGSDIAKSIPRADTIENLTDHNKDQFPKGNIILPGTNNPLPAHVSSDFKETEDSSAVRAVLSTDSILIQPSSFETKKNKKERLNKDWYFSAAVQYTPEWMFNTLEEGKFVNNFGLEGIFTFGKYSIRTGLGLSVTKGTNEFAVEYNDYLGSYNKLDSMSFKWDGSIQNYIPTYYLKSQDVYDSLMKLDYPKVVKRYIYLQIPLVLGYDFLRSGIFSVGLRAGPVLSVLLKSNQLSEEYDPGNKKVISVNNITPEQVSLNWQFMGGINASLRLSRNLDFEIELMAKYYFNSVYEKSEITRKPWSIGVRGAFIIKL